jgi:hypothetical protein
MSNADYDDQAVIPFPQGNDSLDRAAQDVLIKLQRAAQTAQQNTEQAIAVSHKLSVQLRAAEDRIRELEGVYWTYKHRADRAEEWLRRISQEIEQQFKPSADNPATEKFAPKRLIQRDR